VVAVMNKVPGTADVGIFNTLGQPNMNIQIDRQKAARYGSTPAT
jgi:cobalt-zinc-cadmium resistance protein CzcA